ncbi:hypothetical protein [Planomonospora parontospora]|nr:hypothetical protein [Planomonospora parontospora]
MRHIEFGASPEPPPAGSPVQVAGPFRPDLLIEAEAIAAVPV